MKTLTTLKTLLVALCVATSFSTLSAQQTLVAGWDFQTPNATTGAVAITNSTSTPPTPTMFPSNFGTGYLFLDGTNGSSSFLVSYGEISGTTGVNYNTITGDGFSTVVTSPAALLISHKTVASPASDTNGKSIVFKFSMTGYDYVDISYAIFRHATSTDNGSFTTTAWSYSTDGVNFTSIENYDISVLYQAPNYYGGKLVSIPTDGSHLPALANAAIAYLKMTVSGATGTTAYDNIRFDNVKIKAAKAFSVAPTITFPVTTVTKNLSDASFTEKASSNSGGAITYSSDNTVVATVDASSGAVTIVGAGVANITATVAQSTIYAAGTKSYVLTVGTSAVNAVQDNSYSVYSNKTAVLIKTVASYPYEIISANGQIIAKGIALVGENNINVATKGLLFVKVNGHVTKIIQ